MLKNFWFYSVKSINNINKSIWKNIKDKKFYHDKLKLMNKFPKKYDKQNIIIMKKI